MQSLQVVGVTRLPLVHTAVQTLVTTDDPMYQHYQHLLKCCFCEAITFTKVANQLSLRVAMVNTVVLLWLGTELSEQSEVLGCQET